MSKKVVVVFLLGLFLACNSAKKKVNPAEAIIGEWRLTTAHNHVTVFYSDTIYYPERKSYAPYSAYVLYGDSIKTKSEYYKEESRFALEFQGNDIFSLNGSDGIHVYERIPKKK